MSPRPSAFVNYTDGYTNQIVVPIDRVASWMTADLTLTQRIGAGAGTANARGLQLALAIQNLFDRDPPYVNNRSQISALGYDPEKASPTGRIMSVQAVIRW
ncbi:TonB-dependent receptor [Sphingopyxis sp. 113P3]|uniref:TonB-dependent receptor n=1 Tax=Sphingopyxis sp. (strain 113P3) TaxID=292913 RepID=UPI0006AD225D|nr:TonB-dependent receptor [Sphingopyxis sp. 113P3]ALC11315.1 hypothetical protein LH20_05045 [Sphingopyxis sp. 113P3]